MTTKRNGGLAESLKGTMASLSNREYTKWAKSTIMAPPISQYVEIMLNLDAHSSLIIAVCKHKLASINNQRYFSNVRSSLSSVARAIIHIDLSNEDHIPLLMEVDQYGDVSFILSPYISTLLSIKYNASQLGYGHTMSYSASTSSYDVSTYTLRQIRALCDDFMVNVNGDFTAFTNNAENYLEISLLLNESLS